MSGMWEIISMIGSLVLIVLILVATWYFTRWYARRMGQTGTGRYVKVLEKTALATGASVAVVQVGEKFYLLGIGDKDVRLLCELTDFEPLAPEVPSEQPFSQVMRRMMDKAQNIKRKENEKDDGDCQ